MVRAKGAQLRGELAALRFAVKLGPTCGNADPAVAHPIRRSAVNNCLYDPSLSALFAPCPQVLARSQAGISLPRCMRIGRTRKLEI
jgi:hypothetical protein